MEEILSGCALLVAVSREAVERGARSSLRRFLILASVFASPNFQEFLVLRFFHFDDFDFLVFRFFGF
jgi:hypothetical protein